MKPIKGEMDYDYEQDILFFKASGREYSKSIELDTLVIDLDPCGAVIGVQIFGASVFLRVSKAQLRDIQRWQFQTQVKDGKIEIRINFQVKVRNKLVGKNPIIMHSAAGLPDSLLVCEA